MLVQLVFWKECSTGFIILTLLAAILWIIEEFQKSALIWQNFDWRLPPKRSNIPGQIGPCPFMCRLFSRLKRWFVLNQKHPPPPMDWNVTVEQFAFFKWRHCFESDCFNDPTWSDTSIRSQPICTLLDLKPRIFIWKGLRRAGFIIKQSEPTTLGNGCFAEWRNVPCFICRYFWRGFFF